MLTIIPVLLLFTSALSMPAVYLVRPKFSYFWLIAALGSFLAWLLVIFSGFHLSQSVTLVAWKPEGLFPSSPGLILDATSWPFSLAMTTLILAVVLTDVARLQSVDWRAWASSLALTAVGLLAVLARNPLTLLMAWTALDLLELIVLLTQISESRSRGKIVISFTLRVTGTIMLSGAILLAVSTGINLAYDSIPPQASILILLAAALRLGALRLHIPYPKGLRLRRGSGTLLRLIPAAACLALLARLSNSGVSSSLSSWLLILAGLAALYSAWNWVSSDDELSGRPFWVIATAALAIAAAIGGQTAACLAWGLTCLLSGGLIFLNSVHTRNLLPFSVLGLIGFSALPYTLSWNGVGIYSPSPQNQLSTAFLVILSLLTLITHGLLLTGYARHMLRPEARLSGVERWVWTIYPLGLIVLLIITYVMGIWVRPDAKNVPWQGWVAGPAAVAMAGVFWFLNSIEFTPPRWLARLIQRVFSFNWLSSVIWIIYQTIRRSIDWINLILEGDGGILWAVLLLVLILSLLVGQSLGG
jgi:hypothetical protein